MQTTGRRRLLAAGLAAAAVTAGAIGLTGAPAGAAKPLARAELRTSGGAVVGEVVFKGYDDKVDRVEIEIDAPGIDNRGTYHGIHVHTTGSCSPTFLAAGGHWNPTGAHHGHHKGDLPSVLIAADGTAYLEAETSRFDVHELFDGDGSAVVLHASGDNFAHLPGYDASPDTLKTGDGGARYACGVVRP